MINGIGGRPTADPQLSELGTEKPVFLPFCQSSVSQPVLEMTMKIISIFSSIYRHLG